MRREPLDRRRAAADAAGRGRAGGPRRRLRGRRRSDLVVASRWRSSSASPCRSASTTPTTTPTGARHRRRAGRTGAPGGVGLATPAEGQAGGAAAFAVAAVAGLALAASTSWWLLAVGVGSIAAAWGYTGGPRPYGYPGLGEVFVFVFFGLVATVGTTYVSGRADHRLSVVIGCAAGFVACALLVVNNLRDIPTDTAAGKRTLAVRLGDRRTRWLYVRWSSRRSASSWSPRSGARRPGRSPAPPSPCRRCRAVLGGAAARP